MTDHIEAVEMVITGPAAFIEEHCRRLVTERLIACAQVTDVHSTYRWEGHVESDAEARAHLHTVKANVAAVTEATQKAHPYDLPCVLVLALAPGSSPAYMQWVAREATS